MLQRTLPGALDYGPVGHRVGERYAELEDVGARLHQPAHQRHGERGMRVARGNVGDERLALRFRERLEAALDTRHQIFLPERSATVCMSLSPRPDRLTSRIASFFIEGAIFIA